MNKLAMVILCLSLCSIASAQSSMSKIEDFGWLAGCWEFNDAAKNRIVSEQWMKPAGQMMLGMGRTVKGGKTTGFEFTRIVERPGGIFYIAKPAENTEETEFRLIRNANNEAVFENPAHDFPQRVIYRRTKDGLSARVEGKIGDNLKGIDYPYSRAACE
jgi:hypothetical protein